MSWRTQRTANRRDFLRGATGVLAASAGAASALRGGAARAQKAPKNAVAYQEQPKGDQRCDNCQFWIAPQGGGPGQCQIVEGDIAPDAWCNLWAKRQA